MNSSIKRDSTADLLKGIAVLCMIQVHIMELFARQEISDSFIGKVSLFLGGPPAAPLFVAVMGYFLAQSNKTMKSNILRGIKLILLGFILNIALNLNLLIHIYEGKLLLNSLRFLFGVDILFVAGLSIIVISLFRSLLSKSFIVPLSASFIIFLVTPFLNSIMIENNTLAYLNAYLWGTYDWSYFPFFPWSAYVLIGFSFFSLKPYLAKIQFNNWYKLIAVIIWLIFFVYTCSYAFSVTSNLHQYYHHDIIFFIWTVLFLSGFLFTLSLAAKLKENLITDFLKWLGMNVTVVYFIQWIIVGNSATYLFKTQGLVSSFLLFIAIIFLVTGLTGIRISIMKNWKVIFSNYLS